MDYINVIKKRLDRAHTALQSAKDRNKFDVCLRLEGKILALESVFIDLNQATQPDVEGDAQIPCDHCSDSEKNGWNFCNWCGMDWRTH